MNAAQKNALGAIGLGVLVATAGFVVNAALGGASPRLAHAFSLLIAFGDAIFVVGCIQLAKAKGYAWYVGLLGLASCLGLAVLWFALPDKGEGSASASSNANG